MLKPHTTWVRKTECTLEGRELYDFRSRYHGATLADSHGWFRHTDRITLSRKWVTIKVTPSALFLDFKDPAHMLKDHLSSD